MRLKTKFSLVTDLSELRKVSKKVDLQDKGLVYHLTKILKSAYEKLDGKLQGLAATQLGEHYSAVLLRYTKDNPPEVIFNPEVLFCLGNKISNEGCLSEGDIRYNVKRPRLIYVRYFNENCEEVKEWLTYKKARIFMHEYDHTKGILLQDKSITVNY